MRLLALLVVLVLAGCLEQGAPLRDGVPGGSPTSATQSPDATPDATPAPTPDPTPEPNAPHRENATFRTLETGTQLASDEAAREVFENASEWAAFYQAHAKPVYEGESYEPQRPPTPEVDFETERVVAVLMGERSSGCYHVRVMEVVHEANGTVVHVTSYVPGPDMFCTSVVTQPYHYVAIPREGGEVRFEEREHVGAPSE